MLSGEGIESCWRNRESVSLYRWCGLGREIGIEASSALEIANLAEQPGCAEVVGPSSNVGSLIVFEDGLDNVRWFAKVRSTKPLRHSSFDQSLSFSCRFLPFWVLLLHPLKQVFENMKTIISL